MHFSTFYQIRYSAAGGLTVSILAIYSGLIPLHLIGDLKAQKLPSCENFFIFFHLEPAAPHVCNNNRAQKCPWQVTSILSCSPIHEHLQPNKGIPPGTLSLCCFQHHRRLKQIPVDLNVKPAAHQIAQWPCRVVFEFQKECLLPISDIIKTTIKIVLWESCLCPVAVRR